MLSTSRPERLSLIPMSSTTLQRALGLALKLPENERAALVHDLIASLDGPADAGAQQAWEAEITKRLAELKTGNARTVDAGEALRRIDAAALEAVEAGPGRLSGQLACEQDRRTHHNGRRLTD